MNNPKSEWWIAASVSMLAYSVLYFPMWQHLAAGVFGGSRGDSGLYLWLLINNAKNVFSSPSVLYDVGIFYPYHRALAYSDNFLLPSLIAKPFLDAGVRDALVFNGILVAAGLLNGITSYYLARRLGISIAGSLVTSVCYLGSPFLHAHAMHSQLQFAFFLPLALSSALAFAEKQTVLRAFVIGSVICCCFMSSVYYSFFCVLLVAVTLCCVAVITPKSLRIRSLMVLAVGNAIPATLFFLLAKPYSIVAAEFGNRRLDEMAFLGASIGSYFSTPAENLLWGSLLAPLGHFEARFFGGITALVLLLIALSSVFKTEATHRSNRRMIWCFGCTALIAVVSRFVLPDSVANVLRAALCWAVLSGLIILLSRNRQPSDNNAQAESLKSNVLLLCVIGFWFAFASFGVQTVERSSGIDLGLARLLYAVIPGASGVRAVGRYGIVTYLVCCLLAGIGFDQIARSTRARRASMLSVVLLLALVELRCAPFPVEAEEPRPPVWQKLEQIMKARGGADDSAALALPYGFIPVDKDRFAVMETSYMRFGQASGLALLNGYSGMIPSTFQYLGQKTNNFPDDESLAALREFVGLHYLIFMPRFAPGFDANRFQTALSQFDLELKQMDKDEEGNRLFEFAPQIQLDEKPVYFYLPSARGEVRFFQMDFICQRQNDSGPAEQVSTVKIIAARSRDGSRHQRMQDEIGRIAIATDGRSQHASFEVPDSLFVANAELISLRFEAESRAARCAIANPHLESPTALPVATR